MGTQRCINGGSGCPCATIGWVANKPNVSSGIITVEHAVNLNDPIWNTQCIASDRIATATTKVNDSTVDTAYCTFSSGITGSPSIKNLARSKAGLVIILFLSV